MRKYWAHTIDGIDPVIYRTTFNHTFSAIKVTDTIIGYTYKNPI